MSNYQYPDTNDELVCKLIDKVEPFKGYWEKSEKKVIDEMRNEILKYMKRFNIEECFLLDAGCGIGRLVGEFQEYFYRIVAIEPDKKRFAETVKNISNTSYSSKVELRNILIQELDNEEKYDVILCSHILQHIQTEELAKVLQKLKAILKPNGLLLITTCHSIEEEDLYIKGYQTKDGFKEQKITKDEFNILVNTLGVLPSHAFSYDSITKLLTDAGMRVNRINMYHIDKGLEFLNPLDMIVENVSNATGLMKKSLGRDMFVVVINQKDK